MAPKRAVSGWIILDKPYGMSSTQAVAKVRWLYGAEKAGHAGTLDPLATGLLPIALGEATKTVPCVQEGGKRYRFDLEWGSATSTEDAEGEVVATSDVRPTEADLRAALPRFIGTIEQRPPAFSAIKVDGERAYDLARAGEAVALQSRIVRIDDLRLLAAEADTARFEATCGKGTYVRALARDIAARLGTLGHVSSLRRTRVGDFDLSRAITIADIEAVEGTQRDALLLPVATGLSTLPEIRLDAGQAASIRFGNPVLLSGAAAGLVGLPLLFGNDYAYGSTFQSGLGFAGIAIALCGKEPLELQLASLPAPKVVSTR